MTTGTITCCRQVSDRQMHVASRVAFNARWLVPTRLRTPKGLQNNLIVLIPNPIT